MNFFFDNNTSPVLASTIDGYVKNNGDRAFHIRSSHEAGLNLTEEAKDTEWINALGVDSQDWVVITSDKRISKVAAEKEAFRRAGLRGLLLASGYQKLPIHRQASALLWRWPELIETIERFNPPTLIEVPQSKGAKLNQVQW